MGTTLETRFDTTGPINLKAELLVGDLTLTVGTGPTTTVRLHPHGKHGAEIAEKFTVEAHGNDVVGSGAEAARQLLLPRHQGLRRRRGRAARRERGRRQDRRRRRHGAPGCSARSGPPPAPAT